MAPFSIQITFDLTETVSTWRQGDSGDSDRDFDAECCLDERLEKVWGYVDHNIGHANWIEIDLETDDFSVAASHVESTWKQIEAAFAVH